MASSEKFARSNKNQNIQVFVRLRPLNQREKLIRSLGVVEVVNHREVVVRQSQQTSLTKKFTFDRAFSPDTKQLEVYNEVVSPLIAEVLAGYNCTVFAYGQTGTGKTHTMVGESCPESTSWQNDPLAGIIPRALSQLFDELRISNAEYTVRVSYLELYNEELFDLLAATDDNSKLRIYEDANRKGSTIVNGLEEITVYNKNEVYQIMAQGQERKKVASTLMNAQSSRSHTVFTIVVHIKENCPKGEELVKTGKLNLVDLAGSENISKAGSDNPAKKERARECVNINQSLLTLGRVITALVEKHPHIPYRESKLTRILQESLGGRTKTSIIATISPGHKDLEETMSTLEYAHRAKNIQNKPEVNQKLTKQAILKDFAEEIDKLKRELICTREKNGVYIPTETYMEMQEKHEQQRREIADLILRKRAMEEEKSRMEAVFAEMEAACNHVRRELGDAREELHQTFAKLAETEQQVAEQEHLVSKRAETERHLSSQAQQLVRVATRATGDVGALHDTVDKRKTLESSNQEVVSNYRAASAEARSSLLNMVNTAAGQYDALRTQLQTSIDDYTRDATMIQENNIQDFKLLVAKMGMFLNEINSAITTSKMEAENGADGCYAALEALITKRKEALKADLAGLASAAAKALASTDANDLVADVTKRTQSWASEATTHLDSLKTRHSTQGSQVRAAMARRAMAGRAHKTQRGQRTDQRDQAVQDCIQELEKDKNTVESRIVGLQTMMDTERSETEERLNNWVLEERRLYEERLARHVAEERNALNVRLEKYKAELEAQKELMVQATERCVRLQQLHLAASQEEKDADDAYASQCESEQKECTEQIESYEREFSEDTSKIQADVEAFTQSLVQVVKNSNDQLMNELHATLSTVERDCDTMLTKDSASTEQCLSGARAGLASVVDSVRRNLAAVADATAETTSTSITRLTDMCTRTNELAAATQAHQAGSKDSLTSQGATVSRLSAAVGEAVENQAEAEGRYLMREFKVYSPTGQTPSRREYRYPRQLAATSPHDRILQRFREKQRALPPRDSDSDCIVIESDDGKQASDSDGSESTVSEDSAVAMQ